MKSHTSLLKGLGMGFHNYIHVENGTQRSNGLKPLDTKADSEIHMVCTCVLLGPITCFTWACYCIFVLACYCIFVLACYCILVLACYCILVL